ncbi:hypothetical protein B7494_g4750 [Chlorociboria aeruginascens]|nr:hypothetical protein B7494_g4750 [Chlorociboria aeruginascens]
MGETHSGVNEESPKVHTYCGGKPVRCQGLRMEEMDQTVATSQSATSDDTATVPNFPAPWTRTRSQRELDKDVGLIGELHPLNRDAKDAFHCLAARRKVEFYRYHYNFIRIDILQNSKLGGPFVFSLNNLPEFAPLGWRIGRGRKNLRNLSVDILFMVEEEDSSDIATRHARFAWVKGGFFLITDTIPGTTVTLNGETLSNEQRLIPYRNTVGIGECYFALKFLTRTREQDEQFQTQLAAFYSHVLSDSVPLVVPTPSDHEMMMGDWVVRNAIAEGSFGHVYAVTHACTGEAAAAKELWRTKDNSRKVDEEVTMAKDLMDIKHIYMVDKTSTFNSLIKSKASKETRTFLFAQVLEGIAFLHKKGIAHRDIKPANLLVQSYDPPLAKITEFGSATTKKTILYDWPGTIPYLAPEQRDGQFHGLNALSCHSQTMSIIMPTASHQAKPTKPPPLPIINTRYAKPDGSIVRFGPDYIGDGMSAFVFRHGNNVLKIAKVQVTTDLPAEAQFVPEYTNEINKSNLENEKRVYKRLGNHNGIASCFQISADGIELAYFKNGDLEQYLKNHQQVADGLKVAWLRSLVDTLCYIHGQGVFVNDIALRNIFVGDDLSLCFADFGQSSWDTDIQELAAHEELVSSSRLAVTTPSEYRSTDAAMDMDEDIFNLAFVMYSIVVWDRHAYNVHFPPTIISRSDESKNDGRIPKWPSLEDLPNTEGALCGDIIRKCWMRAYRSISEVRDDLYAALPPPAVEGKASRGT